MLVFLPPAPPPPLKWKYLAFLSLSRILPRIWIYYREFVDKAFEENMQLRIAEKTSFLVRKNRATQEITYPLEKPFSSGNASDFTLFPPAERKKLTFHECWRGAIRNIAFPWTDENNWRTLLVVRLDEAGRLALHLPIAPCVKVTEAVTKSTPGVFFPVFCTLCSSHPFAAHSSLVVAFARRRWAPPDHSFAPLFPATPCLLFRFSPQRLRESKRQPKRRDQVKRTF